MRSRARKQIEDQAACWNELRELLAAEHIRFLEPRCVDAADARVPRRVFLARDLPRSDAAGVRPRAPVSADFKSQQELRGRRAARQPDEVRARQGAGRPAAVRPAAGESLGGRDGQTFVFLEDVIHANMQELFPGTQVKSAHLFRIIRDADLEIEQDEADDLLETVDRSLKQLRHGAISLLQVDAAMPARVLNILAENFEVDRRRHCPHGVPRSASATGCS